MKKALLILTSCLLAACQASQPSQLAGVYEGTLPCADCPGIKTTLVLKADQTYTLTQDYQKGDSVFHETGKWQTNRNDTVVQLSNSPNKYYVPEEGVLEMMDSTGHRILSVLNYELKRNPSRF